MPQFSTDESISLNKNIELNVSLANTSSKDLENLYEINKCCNWIKENNFRTVCLQFPDHLLPDSTEVASKLQELLKQTVYVLGDTAYESCCIDYVAAAHINADCIIHFGQTCFSKTSNDIPFLYVYEKYPININKLELIVSNFYKNEGSVDILVDIEYLHQYDKICTVFGKYKDAEIHSIDNDRLSVCKQNSIYVGHNMTKLMNIQLSFEINNLYYVDPREEQLDVIKYEVDPKILKKRHYLGEKIRDAQTLGIVIGTLGITNYLEVINRTKKLAELCHKKYYLISVGKPTVAKLANFEEIDIYVMICCSMNNIFNSHEFYKPIVTPFDVEIALNANATNLKFSYDYNQYLDRLTEIDVNTKESDVSLLTGKLRFHHPSQENIENNSQSDGQLFLKTDRAVALNTNFGAGFLNERSWKGLDPCLGQTDVTEVQEGRKGIAQEYLNEKL